MGGSSSKPEPIGTPLPNFQPDVSKATFSGEYIQNYTNTINQQLAEALKKPEVAAVTNWMGSFKFYGIIAGVLVALILVIIAILAVVDYFRCRLGYTPLMFSCSSMGYTPTPYTPPAPNSFVIDVATYGDNATPGSYSSTNFNVVNALQTKFQNDMTYMPAFTVDYQSLNLPKNPSPGSNVLYYIIRQSNEPPGTGVPATIAEGQTFGPLTITNPVPAIPTQTNLAGSGGGGFGSSSPRSFFQQWMYGSSSGNLISHMFDSTSGTSVPSAAVPTSADSQGAYGVQWWMFVKDWNYGYGKEKTVLSRSDATNSAISNPRVTLAPTENNLRVSVSIFPSEEGGGSKTEPAPANSPGSTDDVFVCEVPNIPLQSWISVSVTVFDRNLDVYINGNLVKSCFLPGVPKPAAGNIDISKDGGFSGYMCDLNHYSKALVPSDAQSFYSAGTSCASQGSSPTQSSSYSMKFGVYDVKGKEVKEYTF